MNSDEVIIKHLSDLDTRAFEREYATFSEFLNINEISLLKEQIFKTKYTLFGGWDMSERAVAGFGDNVCERDFPIDCIKIEPLQDKFSDKLTHRDFLGSLMQLGINRNTLGDIVVNGNTACLFCLKSISGYITDNLTRVKHTSVKCTVLDELPEFFKKEPEETEIITSSPRADAVVSSLFRLSRKQAKELFSADKIFINSRVCKKESALLKEGDTVSVRGYGKFIFGGEIRKTKKDRCVVSIRIYK